MTLLEYLARKEAARNYTERFGKPADDPHVVMNVDANWHAFTQPIGRVLEELIYLGAELPAVK